MQIFDSLTEFSNTFESCVATIGKYDGMHLGHQYILENLIQQASKHKLPSTVILSEPQPEEFFAGDMAPARLTHFQDKVNFLEAMNIDAIFRLSFDQSLSEMPADIFIEKYLVEGLGVKALVVGHDFAFGHKRHGNVSTLTAAGQKFGFELNEIAPQMLEGNRISSTLVREHLERGDCSGVSSLLGRPYSISGEVIQGKQLGRTLGFATANVFIKRGNAALRGVFVVKVKLDNEDQLLQGVANIGMRPTIDNSKQIFLEVHLLDFNKNIYGKNITVNFVHKIRDEKKFVDVDALKAQITLDASMTKTWFEDNND